MNKKPYFYIPKKKKIIEDKLTDLKLAKTQSGISRRDCDIKRPVGMDILACKITKKNRKVAEFNAHEAVLAKKTNIHDI